MQQPSKIRAAVIGVGKMGRYHLEKYLALSADVEVVGFYEPNSERAASVERDYGVKSYASLAELLFEVDAASIASPTETHAGITRAAMQSGVHVLVEKPIASTVSDAEAMAKAAAENKLVLQVGMVERFRMAALAQGVPLQPVLFIETHRLTPNLSRENGIDVVSDLMIHDLDLALSLVSEDPVTVSAIGMSVTTAQTDIANVRLEFPNGAVMNLNASRVSADPVRKMRVFSADAYVSFDFRENQATSMSRSAEGVVRKVNTAAGFDPLLEQTKDFIRCIREGKRPLVSAEDGVRALKYAKVVVERIEQRERALFGVRHLEDPGLLM